MTDLPKTHAVTTPNKKEEKREITPLDLLKYNLNEKYVTQVANYYNGDKRAAMRFMTGYIDIVRRNPKLLECDTLSLINGAMMIASFRFMPSTVTGEAYLIPRKNTKKNITEANFQIGYQGWVTLFYRAGVRAIHADIVRDKDTLTITDGIVSHSIDPRKSKDDRGEAIGAYVKVVMPSGEPMYKYMPRQDIIAHAQRFSKAYGDSSAPWDPKNDPELHMWKKTVLLQMKSLLPRNSEIARAMEEDFKDSTVSTTQLLADGPATGKTNHSVRDIESAAPAAAPAVQEDQPAPPAEDVIDYGGGLTEDDLPKFSK